MSFEKIRREENEELKFIAGYLLFEVIIIDSENSFSFW